MNCDLEELADASIFRFIIESVLCDCCGYIIYKEARTDI